MLQYALIFDTIRTRMPSTFIIFLFIVLSPHSSLYSFFFFFSPLSFFLRHSYQPISSFILFSSHCCCFSLFYSVSPCHLMPISDATPPDVDLYVFCCCFCFYVVVVLVFCCGGSSVRQWWGGMWGVDGWVGQRWVG